MSYYEDVEKKLLKIYDRGDVFCAYATNEPFVAEVGLKVPTQKELQNDANGYTKAIERLKNRFEVEMVERDYKLLGKQRLPQKVVYKEIEPFLKAIGKTEEFYRWREAYEYFVNHFPKLRSLFLQKPFLVLQNTHITKETVAIAEFFSHNPKPQCYIRELPVLGIDTKFIEQNRKFLDQVLSVILKEGSFDPTIKQLGNGGFEKKYGLKSAPSLVRFRIFDGLCTLEDISIPVESFTTLNLDVKRVFIVENLQTYLAFPRGVKTMVVFGKGYQARMLKEAKWLNQKKVYYFGDLDIDGLAILSAFRTHFPQTESFCMNLQTFKTYEKLAHYTKQKTKEMPTNLKEEEKALFAYLQNTKKDEAYLRFEQERIPIDYILDTMRRIDTI